MQGIAGPLDRPPEAPTAVLEETPAALAPGARLGPYEVVGLLGVGGMGEVYRARDTRLGRSVAIKRIRDPGAGPELRRRFEQEARAAGQLNHPNILAIYDVGSDAGLPYLVSELLEGDTLRVRLAGKALPWRRAVEIAGEVCRGLAAAHAHGIVHRDLKPENVFLTRDGRVKLLDFGLAKLQRQPMEEALRTESGMVMGTVGYMSPEQIRGEAVDGRSDLFALGTILYEMLAGAAPFRRSGAVETLAAILHEEPADLGGRRPEVPPALVRIVRHCLEKRPEERFQSAGDLGFQLAGLTASDTFPAPAAAVARSRRVVPILVAAAALLLVGVTGWLLARWLGAPAIPTFRQLTYGHGTVYGLGDGHATALSPDGRWAISHLRANPPPQLVLLPTGPGEPRPLPRGAIAELHWAWWFPDGRRLLVMGNEKGRPVRLFVQDATGAAPRPLAAEGITATGQSPIAPDGRRIVVDSPGVPTPLDVLALPQGAVSALAGTRAGDEAIRWSADGRWLYLKARGETATAPIERLEVATGRREPWKTIRPADIAGVQQIGDVLLTPDASTYVYTYHRRLTDLYLAEGLR